MNHNHWDAHNLGQLHARVAAEVAATAARAVEIYSLIDPRTNRVMYVGQSLDADYRYRQHLKGKGFSGNKAKYEWIQELVSLGLRPQLRIEGHCSYSDADRAEQETIRQYKSVGLCELNRSMGGQARVPSKILNGHKDDWYQLGRKIKTARTLLLEIMQEVGRLAGKKYAKPFTEPIETLDRAKWPLEAAMSAVFPEWKEISRIFCGPDRDGEP